MSTPILEEHAPTRNDAHNLRRHAHTTVIREEALIRKGLYYSPRHGVVAFTLPMFADSL